MQVIEETIQILQIDPDSTSYHRFAGLLNMWFDTYVQVTHQKDLKAGKEAMNSGQYDIIVLEVVWPGHEPADVLEDFMDEPAAADAPILIYTVLNEDMFSLFAYRTGAMECFPKKKTDTYKLEYRLRNLFRLQFRNKVLYHQVEDALHKFQSAHGTSQEEISDLNDLVREMKKDLASEYENRMKLEEEKKKIQSVFGMYVDPTIVNGIMDGTISLNQKGVWQEISVLFADIRGYTSMSESLDSESVISFLNEYFTAMTEVLLGYEGLIDKYMGDAIMCLFGAPLAKEDHRDLALQAAMEMQSVFELWTGNWETNYGLSPRMGIGVASGHVTLGNIGSFQKLSYTAIGDTVNVASRLEAKAAPGAVLISENMFFGLNDEVKNKFAYKELDPLTLKGKKEPQRVWAVTYE